MIDGRNLTKRSRIQVRWSTHPDDLGYGNHAPPHTLPGKASYTGSPRTALAYARDIQEKVGQGVFLRVEYRHGADVIEQGRDTLRSIVWGY